MRAHGIALLALLGLLGAVAPASSALAFHGRADFGKRGIEGGGGGMYYTGSPRSRGYDCTVCHLDAPGRIRVTVDSDPPGLISEQRYVPDQTYALTVRMLGEHRGLGEMLNPNTFTAEITDRDGAQMGLFAGLGPNVERPSSEELVVARGETDAQTEWSFEWTAPQPGAGTLDLWLAAVDGDGAESRLGRTGDPFGDDVFTGHLVLAEDGAEPEQTQLAGQTACTAARRPPRAPLWPLGLLLALVWRRARVSR